MPKRNAKPGSVVPPADDSPESPSPRRMVLRMKSADKMKRLSRLCKESEDDWKPKSSKKAKVNQGKKVEEHDPKKPKKPPTAFFYFLEDFRKEYQEQNPGVRSMRDIGKACGEKWKTMTYEEKVQYYDIATEKRREFDKAMAEYVKRKESGEIEESDPSSESEFE
ncbi:hypothetical protein MLD38_016694 [Melastoma candidum]|uniref:Uncharacterized protein n=1 Tax=Melastoma candidum TaxID=119954 RepID=A0ACB9QPF1_9MYRT|nr:hypothetical protein MLD38_016694 [Melastoma candidum]